MADLVDRISGEATGRPKINLHRFMGAERLYALGEVSAAEIVADFDLQDDELTQATQLKGKIDEYSTANEKALYILRVESVCMCVEDGDDTLYHVSGSVNKSRVYEDLLITG